VPPPPLEEPAQPDDLKKDAPGDENCLSARLNVPYLNFGKRYECKNMQADTNLFLNQAEANNLGKLEKAKQDEQKEAENVEK